LYYCFRKIKSFGAITICIHPLMYKKPCREQKVFLIKMFLLVAIIIVLFKTSLVDSTIFLKDFIMFHLKKRPPCGELATPLETVKPVRRTLSTLYCTCMYIKFINQLLSGNKPVLSYLLLYFLPHPHPCAG
jgi:hypothetical protein